MHSSPHKHSNSAFSILLKYRIGTLVADDRFVFPPGTPAAVFTYNSDLSQIKDGVNFTDWTQDSSVDWNKPFFWQVDKMREAYFEWITVPVDRPLRFFQWDIMEVLTHCSWYVVPLVWLPVVTLLTWLANTWISNPALARDTRSIMPWLAGGIELRTYHIPPLFVLGILLWTLFEYLIHRFIFHYYPPADAKWRIRLHFLLHGQHHKAPFDPQRLVFPPVPAGLIMLVFFVAFLPLFGLAAVMFMVAGGIFGYVCYDMVHYFDHHGRKELNRFGLRWLHLYLNDMQSYHMFHHFGRAGLGYGISTKLWDYVFGTPIIVDDELLVPVAEELLGRQVDSDGKKLD